MEVKQTNGHVVGAESSCDDCMEDAVEFRVMMAYAKRRRPGIVRDIPDGAGAGISPSSNLASGEKEKAVERKKKKNKKKRKGVNRLMRLFTCSRHVPDEQMQNGEEDGDSGPQMAHFRCMSGDNADDDNEKGVEEVAGKLVKITDGIPIVPSQYESDTNKEDDVERIIGLLLKECGDKYNTEVLKGANLSKELFGEYSFFEKVMSTFLKRMSLAPHNPGSPDPPGSPKAQIALTCEVTCRLSAADSRPMSHLVGFGAKYLQKNFSTWAAEHGGYVEALGSEDDDEVE